VYNMSIRRKGLFQIKGEEEKVADRESMIVSDRAPNNSRETNVTTDINEMREIIRDLGGDPSFLDKLETRLNEINSEIKNYRKKISELERKRNKLLAFRKRLLGY